ncbi:MAG: DUF1638 domain-containing protein [Deltaproteobacteria bacterium]|nr:DUF1638 domain-containing protein [Deltaproteobacteria bacterium]
MAKEISFKGYSIVSCGTMRPELEHLKKTGFLDADKILYTAPGLHDKPKLLEKQLRRQLKSTRKFSEKVIVVYGKRCYLDMNDPNKLVETIMRDEVETATRIQAGNCIDFLADKEEREKIQGNRKVYWLTPGWLIYWKQIFKDWDVAMANETFPQNDVAILLDPLDIFNDYAENFPEKLLEFSDWMQIGIEPYPVSLDRFKMLLANEVK